VNATPELAEPRIEVLVGGRCELHTDDGRVLRGELQPAPHAEGELVLRAADGEEQRLPRGAVRLLRLTTPRRAPALAAADTLGAEGGRPLAVSLPALEALTVRCTATHSAPHGGLWLDVRLPDGAGETWHVPPRSLPLLRWPGHGRSPRAAAPRNVAELWAALDRPPQRHARHLGMALVEAGQISPKALVHALTEQAERRERGEPHLLIGQLLVHAGALRPEQLAAALSDWMGVPQVDLREFTPEPAALLRVPRAMAERAQALPLAERAEALVVALADPWNRTLLDELRFASGARIQPVAAAPQALAAALLRAYGVAVPSLAGEAQAPGAPGAAAALGEAPPGPKPPSSAKRSRSIGRRPPVEARRPIAGCLIAGCPIVGCPIAGCLIAGCPITGCEMARRPPRRPPHLGVSAAAAIRR
jgi:hypothetical protein